jgi:hypothetical protein
LSEHSYVFRDIAMVFAAALVCGFLAWRLRQPIEIELAGHEGFLAGDYFPATRAIVEIDMDHAILAREIVAILDAARGPGAGHHSGGAVDTNFDVRGDKACVPGIGSLDRGHERTPI